MSLPDDLYAMLGPSTASQPAPAPPQAPVAPEGDHSGLIGALGNMLGLNAPQEPNPPAPPQASPVSLTSPAAPAPPPKPPVTLSGKFKRAMTTTFNVGEPPDAANADPSNPDDTSNHGGTGGISNVPSYWDPNWQQNFGGVDDPDHRDGYLPKGVIPKQNPFYFALPVGEIPNGTNVPLDQINNGTNTALKPWVKDYVPDEWKSDGLPLLKDRWIEVHQGTGKNAKVVYGQWGDVGPFGEDDVPYVFGKANKPSNAINNTGDGPAGLDISPAMTTALGWDKHVDADGSKQTNGITRWRLVNRRDVPPGPWLDYENNAAPTSQK